MTWLMVALSIAQSVQAQAARVADSAVKAAHDAKMQDFQANDPYGLGVTLISMVIVLFALVVIFFVFKAIGPAVDRAKLLKERRVQVKHKPAAGGVAQPGNEAEVAAVIGLALHQYMQAMREDDVISLTIKEISRRYSPWNDKGFAVTNNQISLQRKSR